MAETMCHRLKLWVMISAAHAACTAILWFWMLGVAGLGFKDRNAWTALDHLQATAIPTLALMLTAPGRFMMTTDSWAGILIPWIANSLLWGAGIVLIFELVRHHRTAGS
ncbi:MAG TPA: hypothetical protein VEC35_14630 [Noviherbaspirillum sp.]|nr:hypothetical protein [Noviherbaspirillum sp.]